MLGWDWVGFIPVGAHQYWFTTACECVGLGMLSDGTGLTC